MLAPGATSKPEYPQELYERKHQGKVVVEIEFYDSSPVPRVKTLTNTGGVGLNDSAEKFALQYRNTCMKPGDPPVKVQQEFDFVPNDGRKVAWSIPAFGFENPPTATPSCVKHLNPGTAPKYPRGAMEAGTTGRLVILAKFKELDKPPEISFPVPGPRADIRQAVTEFAEGYRLTCGGTPLIAMQLFVFTLSDSNVNLLRDTTLKSFLRGAGNATDKPVSFDLDAMSCPFDVRLEYWQPAFRNRVGEVGARVPARKPLLEWLSSLRLNIPEPIANKVTGDSLTISVPCGKIDL